VPRHDERNCGRDGWSGTTAHFGEPAESDQRRRRWTSRGNKTHGRIGCRCLATDFGTTDSSVEQSPEVGCPGIREIAQTAVWSALEQPGEQQGSKAGSQPGFGSDATPKDTDASKSGHPAGWRKSHRSGWSKSAPKPERGAATTATITGLVQNDDALQSLRRQWSSAQPSLCGGRLVWRRQLRRIENGPSDSKSATQPQGQEPVDSLRRRSGGEHPRERAYSFGRRSEEKAGFGRHSRADAAKTGSPLVE
jgi:hypothetical protein